MSDLSVRNILDEQEALITVTVFPGDSVRSQRPVVVTVGIADKQVVMKSGTYEDIPQLIDAAWGAYAKFEVEAVSLPLDDDGVLDETAVSPATNTSAFVYDDDAF